MASTNLSQTLLSLAEEEFEQGNLDEALELIESLKIELSNSSKNHQIFSQYLIAYSIHMSFSQNKSYYDVLKISEPAAFDYQKIKKQYQEITAALDMKNNPSVAAKSALEILRSAWKVLSNPARREAYDIEKGFMKKKKQRCFLREGKSQTLSKGPSREILELLDY